MRHYAVTDEVRVGLGRSLLDWRKTGLLSPEQTRTLRAEVATGLREAGLMLRLGLAAFTVIAGGAAMGLVILVLGMRSGVGVSIGFAVLGAVAFAAATALVRRFRLYRHGVEEALVIGAVGLWGFSAALLASDVFTASGDVAWTVAMAATAAACVVSYRRFGFQYAAVGALYATALLPMTSSAIPAEVTRSFAALVCAAAFAHATVARRRADDDVARADAEVLRAAAVVGAYVALNSVLFGDAFGRNVDGWFKWGGWAVTWLLPFAVGRAAVAERDPLLLRVAIVAGLASLLTNKAHFGWPRQPWDPMLLGVVLVAAALALRRWLSHGAHGERNGFTARPLVASDDVMIQLAGVAAVAVQPAPVRTPPEPVEPAFSGGRSGGAGASSEF